MRLLLLLSLLVRGFWLLSTEEEASARDYGLFARLFGEVVVLSREEVSDGWSVERRKSQYKRGSLFSVSDVASAGTMVSSSPSHCLTSSFPSLNSALKTISDGKESRRRRYRTRAILLSPGGWDHGSMTCVWSRDSPAYIRSPLLFHGHCLPHRPVHARFASITSSLRPSLEPANGGR